MINERKLKELSSVCIEQNKLSIKSIYDKLNHEENKVRLFLINYTIDEGKAFNINSVDAESIKEFLKTDLNFLNVVKSLREKDALFIDQLGNINFIYPVSAIKTNHKVTLSDKRTFYAMCAIDAIGTAFTMNQDVSIQSVCSECSEKVSFTVKNGKIGGFKPHDLKVLHVDLFKHKNWAGNC